MGDEFSARSGGQLSRRQIMAGGAAACFAMRSLEEADASTSMMASPATYAVESEATGRSVVKEMHGGKASVEIRRYPFGNAPEPARFITYTLPPGASEGVHVHFLDDHNGEGAFDEYYFIISGSGQMEIDGQIVPVREGDHIHTPLTVAHGIENTHPTQLLKVFLTFINRKV
ncbi:cupin domain-containing protein [Sphingobium sp.]|uniref:cupin domain-containing protein n=1 Tax=Sphingobium sp. TaxID=1912891 RepID=UPI0028BEF09D|nr:cupin domain-containing protein [Sphingobium sp.]